MRKSFKVILFLSAIVTILPAVTAFAAPFDVTRRTLVVWAGHRKVILEAPHTMCFADRTRPAEDLLYRALEDMVPPDNKLIAFFADCKQLVNWGGGGNAIRRAGYITWRNPEISRTVDLPLEDYLDVIQPTFTQSIMFRKQHAYGRTGQHSRSSYNARVSSSSPDPDLIEFAEDPRRSEYAVFTAFRMRMETMGQDLFINDAEATTVVNGVPIYISYNDTSRKLRDDSTEATPTYDDDIGIGPVEEAYVLIDDLTRALVRINE